MKFMKDFGKAPLAAGHLIDDRAGLAVLGLVGGFVAYAATGGIGVVLVALVTINDMIHAKEANVGKLPGAPRSPELPPSDPPSTPTQPITSKVISFSEPEKDDLDFPEIPTKLEAPVAVEEYEDREEEARVVAKPSLTVMATRNAFDELLASPFQSRAFFGSQRTGKTNLVAIASQEMGRRYRTRTYHLNFNSFGAEDDQYFSHAVTSVRCDRGTQEEVLRGLALVRQFFNDPEPALLIVDEWFYLASLNNAGLYGGLVCDIANKIATVASSGLKRQKAIWTIAPQMVASSLTQDGKIVKTLALCYLTIPVGKTIDWKGNAIGFDAQLFEQVAANYAIKHPGKILQTEDRIAFINGAWMPIGELPPLNPHTPTPQTQAPQEPTQQTANLALLEQIYDASPSAISDPIATDRELVKAVGVTLYNLIPETQIGVRALIQELSKNPDTIAKAIRHEIIALGISNKTAFCAALGCNGGRQFDKFAAIYDWAMRAP